ncbi:hypothetical protein L3N51_01498 [Metallosphaera sp. J1]|uniref:AAA family ATPase n=1 Tax=Metallosphaera javensis (ex Hofmann et al. 2022) TaxID=99938 RepID=UPI001EDDFA6A|nr:ATP-binding protein [Metallosphaera javensis (ex Hofmann et al. 2022)]MCG3109208.1 hypothetical protein [Metallosphaera javensis (ex Hofmann et al. 2022)]
MGGKSYFTTKPRDDLREIFDRDSEVGQLKFLLERYQWATVLGPRMSGKTSLALAVSRSFSRRVVYVDLTQVRGMGDFVQRFYLSIPKSFSDKVRDALESVGVNVGPLSLSFRLKNNVVLATMIRSICDDTIVILDEAQDLRQGINHVIATLHGLLNSCPRLSMVFTGSAIGLIRTLLSQEGKDPLAGRRPTEISLKSWDEDTAKEYLRTGLQECNASFSSSELNETIREIGTLVGWLNVYGVNRCIKPHDEALRVTLRDAIEIVKGEIRNVVEGNAWRRKAMRMLALGATWSELLRETGVSTRTLSNFLDRLERLYMIERRGDTYVLSDPVYRKVATLRE